MEKLDNQLFLFKELLKKDVGINEDLTHSICTTIYNEISNFSDEELAKIEFASPIKLNHRVEELHAFNLMMDKVNNNFQHLPEIIRTQVIVQNYIAFVYLKDSCFEVTKRISPTGSLTKRICNFLLSNPVRAFRNSIAHGNWEYNSEFSGLIYYAHKGEYKKDAEMCRFEVHNEELNFWQCLSRATAYTIYSKINETKNVNKK